MTENEKLRALLAEARREHDGDANIGACGTDNDGNDTRCDRCQRIDAALAKPVSECFGCTAANVEGARLIEQRDAARILLQDVAAACRGLKPLSDEASTVVGPVFRQRDEARAEVERLRMALEHFDKAVKVVNDSIRAAYQRGAKAMREAAARLVDEMLSHTLTNAADRIRSLPVPENEP